MKKNTTFWEGKSSTPTDIVIPSIENYDYIAITVSGEDYGYATQ